MDEINSYLISKWGWLTYSRSRGLGLFNFFEDEDSVKYFYNSVEKKVCYLIKTQTGKEKQKSKKSYKFIIMQYEDLKNPKFEVENFSTNLELFKFIIQYEACNDQYRRHIKIGKIFKK